MIAPQALESALAGLFDTPFSDHELGLDVSQPVGTHEDWSRRRSPSTSKTSRRCSLAWSRALSRQRRFSSHRAATRRAQPSSIQRLEEGAQRSDQRIERLIAEVYSSSALSSSASDRLILLDAYQRAVFLGCETQWYADLLQSDPLMEVLPPAQSRPHAALTLVGSELLAAFRPYLRDSATRLLPPGANDRDLEVAAEHLIEGTQSLLAERLEQERRYGIDFAPEGHAHLSGRARPQRPGVLSQDPLGEQKSAGDLDRFCVASGRTSRSSLSDWILIHDPQAPDRLPVVADLPAHAAHPLDTAGSDRGNPDRSNASPLTTWSWLEPCVEAEERS